MLFRCQQPLRRLHSFLPPLVAPPSAGSPPRNLYFPSSRRSIYASLGIRCGLRGAGKRKPLWRSSVISGEAIEVVQALKFSRQAPSPPLDPSIRRRSQEEVFTKKLSRLLKADLLAVLAELQRQNEWELALQVFDFVRKEDWGQHDLSLYSDMIYMAGKNGSVDAAEMLFSQMKKDGLEPDSRVYTEIIGVYVNAGMLEKAMDVYTSMKSSGCPPTELTFIILIRNLEKLGEHDLASTVKKDCEHFLEYPDKFLDEVRKTYPRRRKIKII